MSLVITRPRDQRVMWLNGWEILIVGHHPPNFVGHRHCGKGDVSIPVNKAFLPKIMDICCCVWPLTFILVIFCKAHGMLCATRISNNKLEHVYMRHEVNSNQFEISLWVKTSLRCKVTSLSAFTWLPAKWNSLRCKFHFGQFDRSEISNRSEFSM